MVITEDREAPILSEAGSFSNSLIIDGFWHNHNLWVAGAKLDIRNGAQSDMEQRLFGPDRGLKRVTSNDLFTELILHSADKHFFKRLNSDSMVYACQPSSKISNIGR